MKAASQDVIDVTPVQQPAPAGALVVNMNPGQVVRTLVERNEPVSVDQLERFMEMQLRWEANEARKAYHEAMSEFKRNPPTIFKDKHVEFTTQKGVTAYNHATIGNVVKQIIAGLAEHDLSHSWSTQQLDGGQVAVTCTITHKLGHSESVTLQAGRDDSGGKNNIQALASAITYLQRYTLLSITGLAVEDGADDDGIRSEDGRAESMLETWSAKARAATTLADLRQCRKDALQELKGNKEHWDSFVAITVDCAEALKAKGVTQ